MSLLGIDIGTSGCKAGVFSEDGDLIGLAYEEYDYQSPQPGWAELDAAQVWGRVKSTIARAASAARGDKIQAVSVSSLGEALVPVGSDGEIVGPSILSLDRRGAEYASSLAAAISAERLYEISGNTAANHFSFSKVMWMKRHQRELYDRTELLLHWSGFVSFMLGAQAHVDHSLANRTLLFDVEREQWSDELLASTGLDRDKLPPPVASGTVVGRVRQVIAEELGLPAGTPIVSGGHDQCCSALGCGVVSPGQAMCGMGTYLCIVPTFARGAGADAMVARGLNTEHHVVPGLRVTFMYNQGGALAKWYRDTFARTDRQRAEMEEEDLYPALFAEMPDHPSRVMVLPHFMPTGPPRVIEDSCGVIAGLTLGTSRGEILRGLLEAATLHLRQSLQHLDGTDIEVTHLHAAGGGSKSDAWVQMCADIFGVPVSRPVVGEAGVLGAAILAGVGCGLLPSLEEGVRRMVRTQRTFLPGASAQEQYDRRFEKYCDLGPLMADYLRDL